ncbi:MAG TPA: hypothetical protein VIV60_24275 [Polyangiaceae bacterium]
MTRKLPDIFSHATRAGFLWIACSWGALSAVTGCKSEKAVSVSSAGGTLAVDGYLGITVGDLCQGEYKLGLCNSAQLIDAKFSISGSNAVEIVQLQDVPPVLRATSADVTIHGKFEGKSRLEVEAKFDDGTTRKAGVDIETRRVTRIEAAVSCRAEADSAHLLPVGREEIIDVTLMAGNQILKGAVLDAIRGAGITQMANAGEPPLRFTWAPTTPGSIALSSPLVDQVTLEATAVAPNEITITQSMPPRGGTLKVSTAYPTSVEVSQQAGGKKVCRTVEVSVTSETPSVCTGRDGELAWSGCAKDTLLVPFVPLQSGLCRLSVSTASGVATKIEVDVVAAP